MSIFLASIMYRLPRIHFTNNFFSKSSKTMTSRQCSVKITSIYMRNPICQRHVYSCIKQVNTCRLVSEKHSDLGKYFGKAKDRHSDNGIAPIALLAFLGFFNKKEEEEDELIMTLKRSVLLIQQGELKQAEKMLHLALRIAQQTQNADGITYVYDLLANVALENGELEKSEKLFVTVMQRLLSTGVPQEDNRVLHMSLKLAEIYMGQFFHTEKAEFENKAKEGFRFCSEALQKKLDGGDKDEDTLLLMSLAAEGHSKLTANQGKHQEARVLMQKALDCSQQSGGDSEERLAALMSDLGALCTMCGDDEAALKHLHQAVAIGRKTDTENLPAFLVNLGLLSLSKGLKSDAQSACKEAWDLSRARKNPQYESEAMFCLNEIKK